MRCAFMLVAVVGATGVDQVASRESWCTQIAVGVKDARVLAAMRKVPASRVRTDGLARRTRHGATHRRRSTISQLTSRA
jgi:hypothetical protein